MSSRTKTIRAARRAELWLETAAPLLLRMVRAKILSVADTPRMRAKERLALAQLRTGCKKLSRGGFKMSHQEVAQLEEKRDKLNETIITEEKATADTSIATAHDTAIAEMTAMGLSAARTATLTTIIGKLRDAAVTAEHSAVDSTANRSARKMANRSQAKIQERIDSDTDKIRDTEDAIEAEGERLGIPIRR